MTCIRYFYSRKGVNDHSSRSRNLGRNITFLEFPHFCGFQRRYNFDLFSNETTAKLFSPKRNWKPHFNNWKRGHLSRSVSIKKRVANSKGDSLLQFHTPPWSTPIVVSKIGWSQLTKRAAWSPNKSPDGNLAGAQTRSVSNRENFLFLIQKALEVGKL